MVDEEATADLCAGMDFDAGEPTAEMRDHAREPAQALAPQLVRAPMYEERMKPGVTGNDFPRIAGGRVALEDDRDFFFQTRKHDDSAGKQARSIRCPTKAVNYPA